MDSQDALTEEQEARRRDGLRILARIIARHHVERRTEDAAGDAPLTPGDQGRHGAPDTNDGPTSATEES